MSSIYEELLKIMIKSVINKISRWVIASQYFSKKLINSSQYSQGPLYEFYKLQFTIRELVIIYQKTGHTGRELPDDFVLIFGKARNEYKQLLWTNLL